MKRKHEIRRLTLAKPIYFACGKYVPKTPEDQYLLAYEVSARRIQADEFVCGEMARNAPSFT